MEILLVLGLGLSLLGPSRKRQKILEPIDGARRQYVTSKLAYFKDILDDLPPSASLMRMSVESNIQACNEELKTGMRVRWA